MGPQPDQPIDSSTWSGRAAAHRARVDRLLVDHVERSRRGERHPVEDFLFTYYSLRPAQLRRWHPGVGVVLLGAADGERARWRDHVVVSTPLGPGVTLDVPGWLARRSDVVRHVRALLAATAGRSGHWQCFGLHEWAMVYRQRPDDVRHRAWPLRLGSAGTDAVVDGHRLRCTHHDAFRFFTAAARPLNQIQPGRADQIATEQPGCLHATMDLYKWAYKLLPAVPSEFVADAFELAREVRELDMRASPYDLRSLGYEPVPIETTSGKTSYVEAQRRFAERGAELRTQLLDVCDRLLGSGTRLPQPP